MKIYLMNISAINPQDKKWYKYLSDKRVKKVERLKKENKKAQSIGAELLLNYAVNQETVDDAPVKWETDKNGKLYLTEHSDIYVNLSHSGEYAVCAVHDKPVGVDIQYCRECDMKIINRFFTHEEACYINNSSDQSIAFFELWTKKESFLKAIGKGITIPLNSFSVLQNEIQHDNGIYRFKEYNVSESGYKLFACYLS